MWHVQTYSADCPPAATSAVHHRRSRFRSTTSRSLWSLLTGLAVTACGGASPTPPLLPEDCFGVGALLSPQGHTLSVGDSVRVKAQPSPGFASCFRDVAFVAMWEAQPDSSVSLSAESDTTAWVWGISPGQVDLTARIRDAPQATGVMTIFIAP